MVDGITTMETGLKTCEAEYRGTLGQYGINIILFFFHSLTEENSKLS